MSTLQRPKANLANAKSLSLESISVSHSISSRPTIPLTPASSTLPIYVFLVRETCAQKAQYRSELPSTPIPSLICSSRPQPPALPPSPSPQRWLKNSFFPNPTSALPRLWYIPRFSCRGPPRSSISAVCVSRTDRQFPLLTFFSWDWNVNEPRTRMAFDWK